MDTTTPEGLRSIDRAIAARLGYTVQKNQKTSYWYLLRPDGTQAINYGTDWAAWDAVPNYSTDLNAAWTLTVTENIRINSIPRGNGVIEYLAIILDRWENDCGAYSQSPSLAICLAWLDFMDVQAKKARG